MTYLTKDGNLRLELNPLLVSGLMTSGWLISEPPIIADIEDREVVWNNGWDIRYKTVEYPPRVTPRQLRLQLEKVGLLDSLETKLKNKNGASGKAARTEFEYATEFSRSQSIIGVIKDEMSLTDEELDTIFLEAAQL